jgi:hypothetical protein
MKKYLDVLDGESQRVETAEHRGVVVDNLGEHHSQSFYFLLAVLRWNLLFKKLEFVKVVCIEIRVQETVPGLEISHLS